MTTVEINERIKYYKNQIQIWEKYITEDQQMIKIYENLLLIMEKRNVESTGNSGPR